MAGGTSARRSHGLLMLPMGLCAPAHRAAVAEPLHLHLRAAGALPPYFGAGGSRMGDLTSMMVYGAPGLLFLSVDYRDLGPRFALEIVKRPRAAAARW